MIDIKCQERLPDSTIDVLWYRDQLLDKKRDSMIKHIVSSLKVICASFEAKEEKKVI